MEGIVPLAIDVGKQKEISKVKNVDMDDEDLEDNIRQVANETNLYPKKVLQLSAKHGKQKKKNKKPAESTIQTRSHLTKSITR